MQKEETGPLGPRADSISEQTTKMYLAIEQSAQRRQELESTISAAMERAYRRVRRGDTIPDREIEERDPIA
jgi:hypothetical protein